DRAFRALLVRDHVHLARRDVRDVLALVEVRFGYYAVLDPRLAAHEVAREPGPVRRGDLEPPLLRKRGLHLPPRLENLGWIDGARVEEHPPPRVEVEPVGGRPLLGRV